MGYEELLIYADEHDLIVKEKKLINYDGRIYINKIAIRKDIPTLKEKYCVLAEELGHFHTTVGNIINLEDYKNYKQELRARRWGYNKTVGLLGIISSFKHGCKSIYEMAEYLDVTEKYLIEVLCWYRSKYGLYINVDNYVIYFEPTLIVLEMM